MQVTIVATNAFALVTHGSRASCWDSILRQTRAEAHKAKVLYKCARTIQRAYRMMQQGKKMELHLRAEKIRQSIYHFLDPLSCSLLDKDDAAEAGNNASMLSLGGLVGRMQRACSSMLQKLAKCWRSQSFSDGMSGDNASTSLY